MSFGNLTKEEMDAIVQKMMDIDKGVANGDIKAQGRSKLAMAMVAPIRNAANRHRIVDQLGDIRCKKCGTLLLSSDEEHPEEECVAASVLLT